MITADDLKHFGKVERCEKVNEALYIKITDGFKNTSKNFREIFELIKQKTDDSYPMLGKASIDNDLFEVELKKGGCK